MGHSSQPEPSHWSEEQRGQVSEPGRAAGLARVPCRARKQLKHIPGRQTALTQLACPEFSGLVDVLAAKGRAE